MQRALALAILLATAAGASEAGDQTADSGPPSLSAAAERPADADQRGPARAERLARAEALLAAGRAWEARGAFEQIAQQEHAADIELGILRSQMQSGQYRPALAFAAHTAGAHPQVGAGAAFYAWLLHLGGQQAIALKTLEQAEQRLPGDPALARVRGWLRSASLPDPVVQESAGAVAAHERLGPYAVGVAVPESARVIGGAVLLKGGSQAIAPLEDVNGIGELWLRNGLGSTVHAGVLREDPAAGLALLALDQALDGTDDALAAEEAFPGSAAVAIGYLPAPARDGAWPRASLGFLGRRLTVVDRPLGIEVPLGTQGAPVLDLKGRLVGIVLPPGADGKPRLGSVAAMRALAGSPTADADSAPAPNRPLDELYERAMPMALQVIAAQP
jgi:hypothetical protein